MRDAKFYQSQLMDSFDLILVKEHASTMAAAMPHFLVGRDDGLNNIACSLCTQLSIEDAMLLICGKETLTGTKMLGTLTIVIDDCNQLVFGNLQARAWMDH